MVRNFGSTLLTCVLSLLNHHSKQEKKMKVFFFFLQFGIFVHYDERHERGKFLFGEKKNSVTTKVQMRKR